MLALGIRYLNGFSAASEPDALERPEWPPHPGRVFMALAAAHFETDEDSVERQALLWLEGLPSAPTIRAPEAAARAVVTTHYVPVNDEAIWTKKQKADRPPPGLESAPAVIRRRNARTFVRVWLQEDDTAYLTWLDSEPPDTIRRALSDLCAKVTRIGHSSSLVHMWLATADELGEPNWIPDEDRAVVRLRLARPGTLADLERRYNREAIEAFAELQVVAAGDSDPAAQRAAKRRLKNEFRNEPPLRLRPRLSAEQGYARPIPEADVWRVPGTVFDPHLLVLTLKRDDGPYRHLDLVSVLALAQRWREALISASNDLPESARRLLSGHDPHGAPLEEPHLSFLPLAFVGHPNADGHLLGMGLALPGQVSREERREVMRAAGRVSKLRLGRLGTWRVVRDTSASPSWNLRPETWTAHPAGATHWSTITPLAFDRHPKATDPAAHQTEVAAMVAEACARIGLPEPRTVVVTQVSAHLGVPPAHVFPRLRRKDGSERRHVHTILVFDEPVRGPILLGAGRYRGYGFCRPLRAEEVSP